MLESGLLAPIFLSRFPFLLQLCMRGEGGGLEASWWTGENKSCLQNKRSRFLQKMLVAEIPKFQSESYFMAAAPLLLIRLQGNLGRDFCFLLESGPYVYVQKASDLRSLLNGRRVPELRQCKTAFKAMSVSPVNTNRLVRQYGTSGVKLAPEGQALRIAVRFGFGWSNC